MARTTWKPGKPGFHGNRHTGIGATDMKTRSPWASVGALCMGFAALAPTVWPALAGDVTAGRQKALQCQTCHGLDGLSKIPQAPNLAGQPEPYLIKALDDFRHGIRRNDMMSLVVKPLSDADVADLAAYYAAIEITAKPPR